MKKKPVIEYYGTQAAAARALGLTRAAVSAWGMIVPYWTAVELSRLTGIPFDADDYGAKGRIRDRESAIS